MLTQSELQKSVGQIRQLYEDRGYQAFVTEKLEVRGDKLVVPIMVGVVKDVDITGIDYETAEYIHSMIENHAGAYYNINLLKRDLTWILNLGFENVNPSFTFQRPGEVGVNLQIKTKPARG